MQYYYDLVALNAANGQRITTLRVWGAAPPACGHVRVGADNDEIRGDDPTFNDFYYTLMPFLWQ